MAFVMCVFLELLATWFICLGFFTFLFSFMPVVPFPTNLSYVVLGDKIQELGIKCLVFVPLAYMGWNIVIWFFNGVSPTVLRFGRLKWAFKRYQQTQNSSEFN